MVAASAVLINYVCPILGSVLGFILSVTPIRAVQLAEKAGHLGTLNPLPSAMFLLNCCAWLLYGAAMQDYFVFCANVPSVPVSLHLILHMYPLASRRVRRQMEATVLASAFVLLFIGMMYVFTKPATALRLNGTLAMLALLLLYASPLSSLLHVVRTRNAASILLPWTFTALGCSGTWFLYGLATKQLPVMVPHGVGVILSIVQLCLRALLPSRPDACGDAEGSESASSSDSEEGYGDEEAGIRVGVGAGQRVVGGAGSPTGCRHGGRGRSRSLSSCVDWEDTLGKGTQVGKGGNSSSSSYYHHDTYGRRSQHPRSVSAGLASEAVRSVSSGSGVELMRRMLPLGRPPHRTLSRVGMLEMEDKAGDEEESSEEGVVVVDLEAGDSTRTTPEPADEKEGGRPPSV